MLDPGILNNLGWGATGLGALWLVLKYKPWKNGPRDGKRGALTSGEESTDFWKNAIREAVKSAIQEELRARSEPLKAEDVRAIMKDVIGDWLDSRTQPRQP